MRLSAALNARRPAPVETFAQRPTQALTVCAASLLAAPACASTAGLTDGMAIAIVMVFLFPIIGGGIGLAMTRGKGFGGGLQGMILGAVAGFVLALLLSVLFK